MEQIGRSGCHLTLGRVEMGGSKHDGLRIVGGILTPAKNLMQAEKLAGLSRLLTGPSARDPLTLRWVVFQLGRGRHPVRHVEEGEVRSLLIAGQKSI